jgi:hypothetical protein
MLRVEINDDGLEKEVGGRCRNQDWSAINIPNLLSASRENLCEGRGPALFAVRRDPSEAMPEF